MCRPFVGGSQERWAVQSGFDASSADNGSIIDFVQKRKGGNLGDVCRALRPWLFELAPPLLKMAKKHHVEV